MRSPRVVLRIGVERVLACIQDRQHVHLGAKIDVHPGSRMARNEVHVPTVIHYNFAEEVDWRSHVPNGKAILRELDRKTVVWILVVFIAVFLVSGVTILLRNERGIRAAAQRVVPADDVSRNRAEHASHVRVQDVPACEMRSMLCFQGVRHVVSLGGILPVVKHRSDIQTAIDVGNAQGGSTLEHV